MIEYPDITEIHNSTNGKNYKIGVPIKMPQCPAAGDYTPIRFSRLERSETWVMFGTHEKTKGEVLRTIGHYRDKLSIVYPTPPKKED